MRVNQGSKYPPDTSWIPPGGHWGAASIALSVVPFAVWLLVPFHNTLAFAAPLACWFIGVIIGTRGLRKRGGARTLAWVGILMNICIPLIGWMLAPLLVGWMMSQGMR